MHGRRGQPYQCHHFPSAFRDRQSSLSSPFACAGSASPAVLPARLYVGSSQYKLGIRFGFGEWALFIVCLDFLFN